MCERDFYRYLATRLSLVETITLSLRTKQFLTHYILFLVPLISYALWCVTGESTRITDLFAVNCFSAAFFLFLGNELTAILNFCDSLLVYKNIFKIRIIKTG